MSGGSFGKGKSLISARPLANLYARPPIQESVLLAPALRRARFAFLFKCRGKRIHSAIYHTYYVVVAQPYLLFQYDSESVSGMEQVRAAFETVSR